MERFAHVKWFVDEHQQPVEPLSAGEWFVIVGGVAIGVAVFWLVHHYLRRQGITKSLDKNLGRFSKLVPYIVRYTTGALLIINAITGLLFAPNVPTDVHALGPVLSVILVIAGILLIVGWQVRLAAALMLLVYAVAFGLVRPIIDVLDHVEYVGIGLYLLLYGSTTYIKQPAVANFRRYLAPESLLRVFVGIGLMILALSEKLVGITNSANFLIHHNWNFLASFGMGDREFIILAGIVEFLVGLTLVLNIAPRVTTAVVAVLMIITAVLLGVEEVFGHLFALSLVAVVWLGRELEKTTA